MKTLTKISEERHEQMKHAEKGRKLLSLINWRIDDLMVLPNGEFMDRKVFKMVLATNEDMNKRLKNLQERKFKIERCIWRNA